MSYRKKRTIAGIVLLVFILAVCVYVGRDISKKLTNLDEVNKAEAGKGLVGEVTLPPSPEVTMSPTPVPNTDPEVTEHSEDVNSITLTWVGDEKARYKLCYRAEGDELWHENYVDGVKCTANGLTRNTVYEFSIKEIENDGIYDYLDGIKFKTGDTGSGDPFKDVRAVFVMAPVKKSVAYTSPKGCLDAKVWVQYDAFYYTDSALKAGATYVKGGTALTISDDGSGSYCVLRDNGRWSVHVSGAVTGWMDADMLLIDLAALFKPDDAQFGIQFNRVNSFSSVFTCGGASAAIDRLSPEDSRYAILDGSVDVFAKSGFNVIKGITGVGLQNYGAREQMPVLWDLALELLTCQKNALKAGKTLLIYDGYRPKSASLALYNAVANNMLLINSVDGKDLAKGYGTTYVGPASYVDSTSEHNKGAAVDVTLMGYNDENTLGAELVMQTKMHTLDFRSNITYNNDNATSLYNIMMTGTHLECAAGKVKWWQFGLTEDTSYYPLIKNYVFADYVI